MMPTPRDVWFVPLRLRRLTHTVSAVSPLLLLLLFAGCSNSNPTTVPVSGRITYNGTPVKDAVVVFHPAEGRPATGRTNKEGTFTLSTFADSDGALVSTHTVTVVADSPPIDSGEVSAQSTANASESPIPAKYASRETSNLTVDVTESGPNDFDLTLTD